MTFRFKPPRSFEGPTLLLFIVNTVPFPVRLPVNVLAPYVITGRLLDLLAKAPGGGRVVNVASLSASYSLDFDNLQVGRPTALRPAHMAFE